MNLKGKTVVVIGAGSGIGRAVAVDAANAGATLILGGRTAAPLEETARFAGGTVRGVDASREEDVRAFFESTGSFDHLVSTIGAGVSGLIVELRADDIRTAMEAKRWAPIFLVKHGAPRIAADGSFTFFSGIRGARPAPKSSITSMVNCGLEGFVKAMALELGPVRVNAISPGIVDSGPFWSRLTPEGRERMFADFALRAPAKRVGVPAEQANAVLFAPDQPLPHRLRAAHRRRRAAHVVKLTGEHPCADRVPHHISKPSKQTLEFIVISEPPSHDDRVPAADTEEKDMSVYEKLKSLAITLPGVTPPVAAFVPFLRSGNLIFISGHIAKKDGKPWTGQLGADITTADGKEAARGIAIDLMGALEAATGNLDSIRRIVKLLVLVNSTPTFNEQHLVANGASELFAEVFGDRGKHARSAFGASQIPFGSCAEIELIAEVAEARAQSQPVGLQAAFARDAGTLSDKFTGLARLMSGKYDWRPGQGVRSVADVFNLIVKENGLLAGVLSGTPNTGASPAPITDPENMQEALKASYLNLQEAIAALSDNDLQAPVKLFGRDMTKQSALMLIHQDQHEHLGQSIGYARSNGVVPPWSK